MRPERLFPVLFFGIFGVVGMGLLTAGVFSFRSTRRFLTTAVSASGVVTENVWRESHSNNRSGSFYPRVRFHTSDGREISFVTNVGSSPPSYQVNEPVTVLYDPQQPYHAYVRSFAQQWLEPVLFGGLGIVFCSIAGVAVIWKSRTVRNNAWLKRNGQRIQAEITRVELNRSLTVNGSNPYWIVCQWLDPASNQMHVFHSANIWFDPTEYIQRKTIDVLIDPNHPHRYLVETGFLPKVV
jgi:Protein of unknown function (DUF3592)